MDDNQKPVEEIKTEEVVGNTAAEVVAEPVMEEVAQPVVEETVTEVVAEPIVEETTEETSEVKEIEAKEEEGEVAPAAEIILQTAEPVETAPASPSDNAKWYIVHTYSGHENKVAKSLKQRVESMGFEERIFDIIVPTRNTIKVSQGKKETVKEKIFPGYVLVKMILDDESWLLVRTTQGVTAFIGAGNKPTPISDKEVAAIQKFIQTDEPLYKTAFVKGEAVKIIDGPFTDFLGAIDAIDEAKGKLKVLVSIFGRETPVELDFLQVSKL